MLAATSLFPLLLTQFVTQALGYFAVVAAVHQLVWRWGRERFRGARIPSPRRVDRAQIRREIAHTLATLVAGIATAGTVLALHAAGETALHDAPTSPWLVLAWVAGGLVWNDLWFYACHRTLHRPWLFRHVHAVHHRSIDVNPFTSYSFHVAEALLLGLWIVPAALWLPMPMAALGALQVIGLANNVMSHLGYEFLPRWLLAVPVLRWTNTATFHNLHHTRSRGNYGLHSRVWDRLFGTELPEYERVFRARGDAAATRSSEAP